MTIRTKGKKNGDLKADESNQRSNNSSSNNDINESHSKKNSFFRVKISPSLS